MKKFLFLTLIFCAIISTTSYAQPAGDPATILQQMKESIKPQMIEKTGLTEALADKVIEINFETRMAASALRDLNEADRSVKIAELKAARERKLNELLTPEQLKSVNAFYEEMGKNRQKKSGN
jgi:Spy/CpxP family protein refolding chaperone